ncbi:nose resistant to fluoxetine protein 6-like isoform X2 [Rhynchophorus ferrugineus]|uniref:nose resistant to fluoxetine protein 6-like isoform X2 n=1 Tax=Rhynchophorus ferrugineus TaxID=354439 RepID=UPI003FCD3808
MLRLKILIILCVIKYIIGEGNLASSETTADVNKKDDSFSETPTINLERKNDTDNNMLPVEDIKSGESAKIKAEEKNLNRTRKPVKLTAKQGFIMNQVLGTYALGDINNTDCKDHINEFKIGLRAFEPWALKMFDSSSKLMSGILNGNLAELGSFRQCLNIYEETLRGTIKGRHCTLRILPSDELMQIVLSYRNVSKKRFKLLKHSVLDGAKLYWSVCVPHTCLNLTISLKESDCISMDDLPDITLGDYIFLASAGLVLVIVTVCTVIDVTEIGDTISAVNLFSLRTNANILFSVSRSRNEIACLDGVRSLTMCYIIVGHRYIHNMATPSINSLDLVDWIQTYFSTLIYGSTVTVDTFFMISSTLLSYNFFTYYTENRKFNLLNFYLYRLSRICIPLAVAIGMYGTILKHFGGGPLYYDFNASFQKPCQYFWWSTLLSIQSFVNPTFLCVIQTWYLSVDSFWFYISPAILLPVLKKPLLGYSIFIVAYILSIAISFYVPWKNKLEGGFPVSPRIFELDYYLLYYIQPICRGSPYLMGLAFGYGLYRTKDQKYKASLLTKSVAWSLVLVCMPSIILISHVFHEETYEYNRLFSSLFVASHRWIWTLCIIWIVWSCHSGNGGFINTILSHDILKILGRLGYNLFLFHYVFQAAMQNSEKVPGYFSNFIALYMSAADIGLLILLAIPLTLCFELPFIRIFGLLVK